MLISFVVLQNDHRTFPALLGSDDGFQVGIVKLTAKDWFLHMFLPPVFLPISRLCKKGATE
jgi:hypothetical protein